MDRSHLLSLVNNALAQPEDERVAWLKQACDGDDDLFRQALHLLETESSETAAYQPNPDDPDYAGVAIGVWKLVRPLGKGGMGSVWLAERDDGELRMNAAVKLIKPVKGGPDLLERFRRERQIMADLSHPNISVLYDAGTTDDGHPYLVMEYVDGDVIDRYCDTRELSRKDRVALFRQACDAVRFAHRRGVIHRDIKPANIMVTQDGVVKLMDFGIAHLAMDEDSEKELTQPGQMMMTPEYASPEQIRGLPAGAPGDIYSLGLVLARIVTGFRPRQLGPDPGDFAAKTLADEAQTDTGRRRLGDILRKALYYEVAARFESVNAFFEALDVYLQGGGADAEILNLRFDALIWHGPRDRDLVEILTLNLERKRQLKLWTPWRQSVTGERVVDAYARALKETGCVVIIAGRDRPWEDGDVRAVLEHEVGVRRIVPVQALDGERPERESDLPTFMRDRTWAMITHGDDPTELAHLALAICGESHDATTAEPMQICPFRGLESFREEDARFFFGRDAVTQRLFEHMRHHRFLAVLGPSGSGKSSVVQAGLAPKLRQDGLTILRLTPTATPLSELAYQLYKLLPEGRSRDTPELMLQRLSAGDEALHFMIRELREGLGVKGFCLVVDQFEELFTLAADDAHTGRFIASLLYAVEQRGGDLCVVIAMRSDFLGHCVRDPNLNHHVMEHAVQIGPMNQKDLSLAVTEPARLAGLRFEDGLAGRILEDVAGALGELPLLEHALMELWERRRGRTLTLGAYTEIGGIEGALSKRAESEYQELDEEDQSTLRKMFTLCLIHPGEGAMDTRRRATRHELIAVGEQSRSQRLLARFVTARLLTAHRDETRGHDLVEVAHESLIRKWPRIKEWMDQDRETARLVNYLRRYALGWHDSGRDVDHLMRGAPLLRMRDLMEREADHLGELEKIYVLAGLAEEEKKRRRKKVARRLVAVLGIIGMVLGVVSLVLFARSRAAEQLARQEQQRAIQETRQGNYNLALALNEKAGDALADDPHEAWLLSLAALSQDIPNDKNLPEVQGRFLDPAMQGAERIIWTSPIATKLAAIATNPAGDVLALAGEDRSIRILDVATGVQTKLFSRVDHRVSDLVFSPSGAWLAATTEKRDAHLWRLDSGEVRRLAGEQRALTAVAFSSDERLLVLGGVDGLAVIYDLGKDRVVRRQDVASPIRDLAVRGNELYLATDAGLKRLNIRSGRLRVLSDTSILTLAMTQEGVLASGGADGVLRFREGKSGELIGAHKQGDRAIRVLSTNGDDLISIVGTTLTTWDMRNLSQVSTEVVEDVRTVVLGPENALNMVLERGVLLRRRLGDGQVLPSPSGFSSDIYSVVFFPDGERIVAGSLDGMVQIWNLATQEVQAHFRAGDSFFYDLAVSSDGAYLATASVDELSLWDVDLGELIDTMHPHEGHVTAVAFSPDGRRFVTSGDDGVLKIWDRASGLMGAELRGHQGGVYALAWSPDGDFIASGSDDQTIRIWNSSSMASTKILAGHEDRVWGVEWSKNSRLLVSGSSDQSVRVWDVATGEAMHVMTGHSGSTFRATFSPDGAYVISPSLDQTIGVWDVLTGRLITYLKGHHGGVYDIALSPDGSLLASVSVDDTLILWNMHAETTAGVLRGHDKTVMAVDIASDGVHMASASFDNSIRIWDLRSARTIKVLNGHGAGVNSVAFSPDGQTLASASNDQTVRLWNVDSGREQHVLKGHTGRVAHVAFSADGSLLASGSLDRTVRLWEMDTGETLDVYPNQSDWSGIAFSPTDNRLVTVNDALINIWNIGSGEEPLMLSGHLARVAGVDFSSDGARLASGSEDQTARIWDSESGALLHVLRGHEAIVYGVAFSPDGKLLATGSGDRSARLWDVESGRLLAVLHGHQGELWGNLDFSPSGDLLATPSTDMTVRLWRVDRFLKPPMGEGAGAWYRELLQRSLYFYGYQLNGFRLMPQPHMRLHGPALAPSAYDHLDYPRPVDRNFVEWLMQGYVPD